MKPQSRKAKGRSLQNKVRDKLRGLLKAFGCEDGDVEGRGMGQGGSDVILSPKAKGLLPVEIECKKMASFAVYKHYEQAKSHGDLEPVLVIEGDRKKPLVVIDLDYWIYLEEQRIMR